MLFLRRFAAATVRNRQHGASRESSVEKCRIESKEGTAAAAAAAAKATTTTTTTFLSKDPKQLR